LAPRSNVKLSLLLLLPPWYSSPSRRHSERSSLDLSKASKSTRVSGAEKNLSSTQFYAIDD